MAAAYRGTVDDHGEDEAWHCDEAEGTLAGRFGAVLWEASVVAVGPDDFAGASLVTDQGTHLLLAFALVAPRWQRRGVGNSLIARSAHALIGIGAQEWTLAVTDGNPARNLYERLGFVADESLRRETPGPSD
jgi:predicted N-acetyltransferase YhbS